MIVNFYTTLIYSIWYKHQNPLDAIQQATTDINTTAVATV